MARRMENRDNSAAMVTKGGQERQEHMARDNATIGRVKIARASGGQETTDVE